MRKTLGFLLISGACLLGLSASAEFLELREPEYGMGCYHYSAGWFRPEWIQIWGKNNAPPGIAGVTCKAAVMGDASRAAAIYGPFMLDYNDVHSEKSNTYLQSYATQIVNLVEQMAADFYRRRAQLNGRKYTNEELQAFVNTVLATGYQESKLTHFQLMNREGEPEERLNILVGDSKCRVKKQSFIDKNGNQRFGCPPGYAVLDQNGKQVYGSKGMFQFLLSSHTKKREMFFDLVSNIQEGIIYIYEHWSNILRFKDAPAFNAIPATIKKCNSAFYNKRGGIYYDNVARGVYSAYNGGPGAVCRFILERKYPNDPASAKSAADRGFNARYTQKPWLIGLNQKARLASRRMGKFHGVDELRYQFPFDLDCARNGHDLCIIPQSDMKAFGRFVDERFRNRLFVATLPEQRGETYCAWDDDKNGFLCTPQEENVPCLQGITKFARKNLSPKRAYYELHRLNLGDHAELIQSVENRQELCSSSGKDIATSGRLIKAKRDLRVFSRPDTKAKVLRFLKAGEVGQVVDFEINPRTGFDRWYKLNFAGKNGDVLEGYVYGGDELDHADYVALVGPDSAKGVERYIPLPGDIIRIKKPATLVFINYQGSERIEDSETVGYLNAGQNLLVKGVEYIGEDEEIVIELVPSSALQVQNSTVGYDHGSDKALFHGNEVQLQIPVGQIKTHKDSVGGALAEIYEVLGQKADL